MKHRYHFLFGLFVTFGPMFALIVPATAAMQLHSGGGLAALNLGGGTNQERYGDHAFPISADTVKVRETPPVQPGQNGNVIDARAPRPTSMIHLGPGTAAPETAARRLLWRRMT